MGRGVSCGGGQSSLGYLFGNGEAPPPPTPAPAPAPAPTPDKDPNQEPSPKTSATSPQVEDNSKQTPSPPGTTNYSTNNYYRADGQNCGNFITDRPSTKVHAAPGGGSSLNYLFGDGKK